MGILKYVSLLGSTVITGGQSADSTAQVAAQASAQQASGSGSPFSMVTLVIMYAAIFGIAYFLWIRPQKKREKTIKEMQQGIKTGDNIVTNSGLYGKVVGVGEDCFVVEFGTNKGVRIPVRKSEILAIKEPKLTPQPAIEESK